MSNRTNSTSAKNDMISLKIMGDDGIHSLHNFAGKYGSQPNNPNIRRIHFDISNPLTSKNTSQKHSASHEKKTYISVSPKAVSSYHDLETPSNPFLIRPQTASRLKINSACRIPAEIPTIRGQDELILHSNPVQQQPEHTKSCNSAQLVQSNIQELSSKETGSVCPLECEDLPLTTEHDHKVFKCYCYLCTCGNHKCPGEMIHKNVSPANAYSTTYHINFRKKPIMPSSPLPIRKEIDTKKTSGVLATTHQTDFKPFQVMKKTVEKSKQVDYTLKLATLSQYKLNFPDWGPSNISIEKRYHPKYQGDQIKLADSTTYKSTFPADTLAKLQSETQFPKSFKKSTLSLSSSPSNFMMTTAMRDFKAYSPQQLLDIPKTSSQTLMPVATSCTQFTTTYNSDFRTTSSSSSKIPNRREMMYKSLF